MNAKETIGALTELLHTTIEAVSSYEQALPKVEDEIMRQRLDAFRKSHEIHIQELAQAIAGLGGHPPDLSKGISAYFREGVTALRSMSGTKGALKALQSVEEATNRSFGETVSRETPDSARDLLRKQFSDVKVHLEYINSNLKALA